MMRPSCKYLAIIALFTGACISAASQVSFPLKFSSNKRHFVDQSGKPFLVKEFSAWGLIQALPENEAAAFLDSIKRKGFNTVITCMLSDNKVMAGSPPGWQGILPLKVKWDFSTPDPLYFAHVDRLLELALQKGIFVMVVPVYLGYKGDGSQGWWDEMLAENNDTLKMKSFGAFLGNRYKSAKNIMWIAGGDNNADGDLYAYENNLIKGIKEVDKSHFWSGHFDTNQNISWSTEHRMFGGMMDIDGLYVWTETVLMDKGPQYKTELDHYNQGRMIIQLDQSYEHDVPHYADNENYQWLRRKMYDGLLSGCKGTSFSSGTMDNQCYTFKKWRPLMNTEGIRQVADCFRFFESRAWEKLVPDQGTEIIISGRGSFGELDYICAALASDSSSYILYIPAGHTFYLNVKKISGRPMRMHWFNPRNGEVIKIGVAETREKFGVAPPSGEDWVLVFDDEALKLPAPGTARYHK